MKSCTVYTFLALILTTSFLPRKAHSQQQTQPQLADKLETIARQMQNQGIYDFIAVRAYIDGLIEENQDYSLSFYDGIAKLNNRPLPEPYQTRYTKLTCDFMVDCHNNTGGFSMSRGGNGFTLVNILDENSDFRKQPKLDENGIVDNGRKERELYKKQQDKLITELAKAEMIDTAGPFTIAFNETGIYINNTKLRDWEYEQYLPLFTEFHGEVPAKNSRGGFSMRRK